MSKPKPTQQKITSNAQDETVAKRNLAKTLLVTWNQRSGFGNGLQAGLQAVASPLHHVF